MSAFVRKIAVAVRLVTLAILILMAVPRLSAQRSRAHIYVDKGACSGEGCGYGRWQTTQATIAYAAPDERSRQIGYFRVGTKVAALTGSVYTVPGQFVVKKAHGKYKVSDVIRVYTYHGEGWFKVQFRGRWYREDLGFSPWGGGAGKRCEVTAYCWGELKTELKTTWWVRVKSAEGWIGWTNQPGHFDDPPSSP
jgi:hypothetical protein